MEQTTPKGIDIRKLQLEVSRFEQLGAQRADLVAFISDDLKALDAKRTKAKEKMSAILKDCADIDLATQTCNILAPTSQGADDATRKRLSRRRSTLRAILAKIWPDYEFSVTKGQKGGKIEYVRLASKEERHASYLYEACAEAFERLGLPLPAAITKASLAAEPVEKGEEATVAEPVARVKPLDLSALVAKINARLAPAESECDPSQSNPMENVA